MSYVTGFLLINFGIAVKISRRHSIPGFLPAHWHMTLMHSIEPGSYLVQHRRWHWQLLFVGSSSTDWSKGEYRGSVSSHCWRRLRGPLEELAVCKWPLLSRTTVGPFSNDLGRPEWYGVIFFSPVSASSAIFFTLQSLSLATIFSQMCSSYQWMLANQIKAASQFRSCNLRKGKSHWKCPSEELKASVASGT